MYKVGDLIVYGSTGVCEITEITPLDISKAEGDRLYYTLNPLFQDGVIYTPVDTKVYMRPVISAEEAENLIRTFPKLRAAEYHEPRKTVLKARYASVLKSHNFADLISLIKSIYAKKRSEHKVGLTEERVMKQAEELLYGELSVALGIPREAVLDYIRSRIEGFREERTNTADVMIGTAAYNQYEQEP